MSTTRRLATLTVAVASAATLAPLAPASAVVPASTPKPYVQVIARVNTASLSVRAKPTAASARVGVMKRSAFVNPVCSVQGQSVGGNRTWYWTGNGTGTGGWVSARYVKVTSGQVPRCSSYPGMKLLDAVITSPSQVDSKLAGTSASFRAYMTARARAMQKDATKGCPVWIDVSAWWADNQAVGGVGDCGGAITVWTRTNGHWHETGWNGDVLCSDLRRAGATHAIPGTTGVTCYVRSGTRYTELEYTPRG